MGWAMGLMLEARGGSEIVLACV